MIINVVQTKAAFKQEFDIIFDDELMYNGKLGTFGRYQSIHMTNDDGIEIKATFRFAGIKNYIPFSYIFGITKFKNYCNCYRQDDNIGSFCFLIEGITKQKYIIKGPQNEEFIAYNISKGQYSYLCIYNKEHQIAQIESDLCIQNGCNEYVLYLLDNFAYLAELLSLFVLYFDNLNNTQRGEIRIGTTISYERTFSKYNDKLLPNWKNQNFRMND